MIEIKFKKIKISSLIASGLIMISLPMAVLAYGTSTYQKPYPGSQIEKPYGNEVSANVDTSRDYMYFTSSTKAIGYDFLYGSDKGLIEYFGEVSKEDHKNKKAKDYYYYPSDTIDGYKRHFADSKDFKEDPSKVTDPRYKSLTVSHGAFNVAAMVTAVFTTLQKLFALILKFWISIANFDIGSILDSLNGASGFSKTLSTLFLINPDNGTPSPLFTLSLGFFMFRFVSLAVNLAKGGNRGTAKGVFQEVGLMFAALVLASLFSVANGPSSLASTATNFTSKLGSEIAAAGSPASGVFATQTDKSNTDIITTQSSQVTQIWINQIIQAQFGVSVNDLWIEKDDGTSSFGDKTDVTQAINDTFAGEDPGLDGFKLSNGNQTINNLGYWYYAANSNTAISRNGKPFAANGKNTDLQQNASAARTVLAVDFLANLRKIKAEKKDSAMVAKIDNIMNYLTTPSYGMLFMSSIVIMILYGIMVFSLLSVGIFAFSGKVICSLGVYAIAVMPLMMLIKKTRKTAKGLMVSYLMAFMRYLSGSALFNLILAINVLLASNGLGGMAVAMVVSLLMTKASSHLIQMINQQVTELGRNLGEHSGINRFNGVQLQRAYQEFLPGGRRTKQRNKKIKSILKKRDGESKGNKSLTDHVAQGFNSQQGFAKGFMNSILGKRIDKDFESNLLYHENWDKDVKRTQEEEEKRLKEAEENSRFGVFKRKIKNAKKVNVRSGRGTPKFRTNNGRGIGRNAAKIATFGAGSYLMYKAATTKATADGAVGLSKAAARVLNGRTPIKFNRGAEGTRMFSPKTVAGGAKHAIENASRKVSVKRRYPVSPDGKVPAENKRVLINPSQTPEYGNRQIPTRKAPSGQRTSRRKPILRQQSNIPTNPATNTRPVVRQENNNNQGTFDGQGNGKRPINRQNSSQTPVQNDGGSKTPIRRSSNPIDQNVTSVVPGNNIPTREEAATTANLTRSNPQITKNDNFNNQAPIVNDKPLTRNVEGSRNVTRQQEASVSEGTRNVARKPEVPTTEGTRQVRRTEPPVNAQQDLTRNSARDTNVVPNAVEDTAPLTRKQPEAPQPAQPAKTQPTQPSRQTQPSQPQAEGTRNVNRKQPQSPATEGTRKPIVTDAMRAHGESIKTNIKMRAAGKVPIVGEMLATKISKQHDNNVKAGKRISERAAELAKETAVKSGGRRTLTPQEAIQQATQEMLDKSMTKPTSQHSAKEIKRIEKANRKARKSIEKASKFVDRSEIIAKMTKK